MSFPLSFDKYGEFLGAGTSKYKFKISDRPGLAKAMGAGLFPNPASIGSDPEFNKWKTKIKGTIEPWDYVNSGDPQADFYAWTQAKDVGPGVKMFFTAQALEEAGHYKQA